MTARIPRGSSERVVSAERAELLTKSDSTVFTWATRGLYVGGAGDVAVRMLNQLGSAAASVTFVGVAAGTFLPIECDQLLSTGTTATNVVGLW